MSVCVEPQNRSIDNKKSFQPERTVDFAQLQQSPLFTQHVNRRKQTCSMLKQATGEKTLSKSSPPFNTSKTATCPAVKYIVMGVIRRVYYKQGG